MLMKYQKQILIFMQIHIFMKVTKRVERRQRSISLTKHYNE